MKVELQCGDTIAIPEGCKAVIKDGSVVIEKKVQEFKDGDILVSVANGKRHNAFVYKSTDNSGFHSFHIGIDICGNISFSTSPNSRWGNSELSYATEEEKQLLFDKMKEQRLRWNADKKCTEKLRWRAKLNERYYFFDEYLNVKFDRDENFEMDILRWGVGNYFETADETREAAKRVREILRKYRNGVS